MGYAFHITRAENWFDSESAPISREEWERLADEFAALRADEFVDWTDIGPQKLYVIEGETASFSWRKGKVDIEGSYTDVVEEIANELASLLGGKVQGDDED
ncbi:hypothetical protein [Catellatospora vulcania]|uniref:hypothetical protein n=1 Tax=Catellatospora vulcania TaxID=1460450 RepID=UPI0012D450BD|nr:hypothetical protein [Catellatospora vulcania]